MAEVRFHDGDKVYWYAEPIVEKPTYSIVPSGLNNMLSKPDVLRLILS